ncbi:MAG: hypothetical protein Q8M24_11245 [Pseudolabrys sp.]|nr:hypothetical protein [Pseudolabrys sp.]
MRVRRSVLRFANRILSKANLSIGRISRDFDSRLDDPKQLGLLFRQLAEPVGQWLSTQRMFDQVESFDVENAIAVFYSDYIASPFRTQGGGSRFNNLMWLNIIAKAMQPLVIVDSGTFTGASAWALAHGAPLARVYSFDVDSTWIKRRSPNATYLQMDWSAFDFMSHESGRSLCYFDDHIDQARRIIEAKDRGFSVAIFDDDFPVTAFAPMANGGAALPKIEFLLDDDLLKENELSWLSNGRRYTWRIDRDYFKLAKSAILRTERLPNTALITGIHQTPYRIVALQD